MKVQLIIGSIALSFASLAQKEKNTWYFGDHAGLDFNSGIPVAITNGSMFTYDNCTSVSDNITGNILFYSNGVDVWNSNHSVMPNGSGLLGNTTGGNSAFAVKQPGSNSLYYLFTNDAYAGSNGLRYSIVDMTLSAGLGDITTTKNIQLLYPCTEKVCAVLHNNMQDIWIIVHGWNNDEFYAYLLSNTGLNATPVVSQIGSVHSGGTLGTYNSMGQIAASPDGFKIGLAIFDMNQFELFDFNRTTGVLSNAVILPNYSKSWGIEFSGSGSKIYTSQWGGSSASTIRQFDISSFNQSSILASESIIGTATSPDPNYKAGYMQRGPDDKIYVAKFASTYLAVINLPNNTGIACNFVDNGIDLNGKKSQAGLPSFIQTRIDGQDGINEHSGISLSVYPNPAIAGTNIRVTINASNKSFLRIIDVLGHPVYEHYFNSRLTQFTLNGISRGLYQVILEDGHGFCAVQKILIL